MATILCSLSMLCILYMDPILSVRLTDLGMNEKNVGYAFALIGIAFGLGGPSAGYLCSKLSKQLVMQLGLICCAGSCIVAGPSQILGLPPLIWLMFVG